MRRAQYMFVPPHRGKDNRCWGDVHVQSLFKHMSKCSLNCRYFWSLSKE